VAPDGTGKVFEKPESECGGFLEELSRAVSTAIERLPSASAITEVAQQTAGQAAQAQTRMHAASQLGTEQLEQWARAQAAGSDFAWHELLAGAASSVLTLHALIAAAADPATTAEDARHITDAYLPACVLLTLLDGLVDHDDDTKAGRDTSGAGALGSAGLGSAGLESGGLGYIDFYEDPEELSQALTEAAQRAATQARALHNGPHHAMTLVGVVAYYTSDSGARGELAAPIVERLQHELAPMIYPTLVVMRAWRLAKRARAGNRRAPHSGGLASSLEKASRRGGCNEI